MRGSATNGSLTRDRVAVLGVDDHPMFLDVAREVVAATPGFEWVGGAVSGAEALDAVTKLSPGLVLLDVRMPGMDGIETAERISERDPDVVIVLMSIEDSAVLAPAAAISGAAALIHKREFGPTTLRRLWSLHGGAGGLAWRDRDPADDLRAPSRAGVNLDLAPHSLDAVTHVH
jgi:two-component system, NarL family, invasion response regulator UvrY